MGSVSVDIHKQEREFRNLTLSDRDVVKYLILYRNKVDTTYGTSININMYQAGDTFEFNQELISLYASLDKLIQKISLNEKEVKFLELIFDGNTVADVFKVHKHYPQKTAYRVLERIVESIVEQNHYDWEKSLRRNIYKNDTK